MKPRQQRMLGVGLTALGVAIAAGLTLRSFDENMMFFVDVSDVVAGDHPMERNFRIGGLVVEGSVEREEGSMDMTFRVTDLQCEIGVRYSGVLPDLFREGQGVVAHGLMGADGIFVADKILAKHDEDYMSPEVAESLARHVEDQTTGLPDGPAECDSQ